MKRPILFSAALIVTAFCICFWGLSPRKTTVALTPALDGSATPASEPRLALWSKPASSANVVASAPVRPVTDDRRRIYDSPSIMAAIDSAKLNGTQDEKDWANALLSSCIRLFSKPAQPVVDPEAAPVAKAASSAEDLQLDVQKRRATDTLRSQCKGIDQLTVEERTALKDALTQGSAANHSVLAQLRAITDDRWSGPQSQLLSESLYSSDPIVSKTAFFALLSAFDSVSPGGQERQKAFMMALGPQ